MTGSPEDLALGEELATACGDVVPEQWHKLAEVLRAHGYSVRRPGEHECPCEECDQKQIAAREKQPMPDFGAAYATGIARVTALFREKAPPGTKVTPAFIESMREEILVIFAEEMVRAGFPAAMAQAVRTIIASVMQLKAKTESTT